jgi:hypothetical protein
MAVETNSIDTQGAQNLRGIGMKRAIMILTLVVGLAVVFFACKNDDSATAPTGTGIISGTVVDSSTGLPLSGVTVTAQPPPSGTPTQVTDATGTFSFEYSTDSARTVTLTFAKSGFRNRTIVSEASSGQRTTLNVAMASSSPISGGTSSGVASTIYLANVNPTDIFVYGIGANETSYLIWEVRDSVGLPIDAAHAVTLTFSISGGLNGGEFMYPVSVTTNAQGRGTTSLSSGIVAGAVQVVATTQAGGRTIISQPARVVIHSGFPDQRHFSIAPEKLNFPALGIVGSRNPISVLVGDIYSNPVTTNTAVYFATRAGVIVSSAFTNPSGEATADLISGNPFPLLPNPVAINRDGYQYVIASTPGRNGTIVKDSALILWSGASMISNITPGSFNIPNAGSQRIDFVVSDAHGNTLSAPTGITVTVTGAQAEVAFGINGTFTISQDIILPPGSNTQFSCIVSDSQPDTNYVNGTSATMSISVNSTGNGNATATISGTIH